MQQLVKQQLTQQTTSPSRFSEASTVRLFQVREMWYPVEYKTSKELLWASIYTLTDATSWTRVYRMPDLAGGTLTSPRANNKTAKTTISKGSPVTITLERCKGVKIRVSNQRNWYCKINARVSWIWIKTNSGGFQTKEGRIIWKRKYS